MHHQKTFNLQAAHAANHAAFAKADAASLWRAGQAQAAIDAENDAMLMAAQSAEARRRSVRGEDPYILPVAA